MNSIGVRSQEEVAKELMEIELNGMLETFLMKKQNNWILNFKEHIHISSKGEVTYIDAISNLGTIIELVDAFLQGGYKLSGGIQRNEHSFSSSYSATLVNS
jgi:hypothetical protein